MHDAKAPRAGPRARPDRAGWLIVAVIVASQGALFHRHAIREVVWTYRAFHDQASYLDASYRTYEAIRQRGWRDGLLDAGGVRPRSLAPSATGALLHIEAALVFFVLGPGRMSALWLGFAHFVLFQIVLVGTVRTVGRRWSVALIALGLLLCARAPFRQPGGIFDFRLDFITQCLFGVFVCVVIRSGAFSNRRWAIAAGVAAAWVIAFRFLTAAYFAPIFAALLIIVGPARRRDVLLAGGTCAVLVLPILCYHRSALSVYYVAGHLSGVERYLRAEHEGVTTLWTRLTFYPKSLATDHTGPGFCVVAAIVLLASRVLARHAIVATDSTVRAPGSAVEKRVGWFLGLCLLVPMAVLSMDVDKSRVVGGIMLPPLVCLIVLPLMNLPAPRIVGRSSRLLQCRLELLAAVALAGGIACQSSRYLATERRSRHPGDTLRLLALYDRIARSAQERNWTCPRIATDCHADYLAASAINVMVYERHHILLNGGEILADRLLPRSEDEVFSALRAADLVILTRWKVAPRPAYPLDRQMQNLHPRLLKYCEQNLRREMAIETSERRIVVFIRGATSEPAAYTPTTRQTAVAAR